MNDKIYLCAGLWERRFFAMFPDKNLSTARDNGQLGILIHEMAHRVDDMPALFNDEDEVYGCNRAEALARRDGAVAARNAENYGCFGEDLYSRYVAGPAILF